MKKYIICKIKNTLQIQNIKKSVVKSLNNGKNKLLYVFFSKISFYLFIYLYIHLYINMYLFILLFIYTLIYIFLNHVFFFFIVMHLLI